MRPLSRPEVTRCDRLRCSAPVPDEFFPSVEQLSWQALRYSRRRVHTRRPYPPALRRVRAPGKHPRHTVRPLTGMPFAAKTLEIPVGTVKSRAHRARAMLRTALTPLARERRLIRD